MVVYLYNNTQQLTAMIGKSVDELKKSMRSGDQTIVAKRLGVSQQLISDVLLKKRKDHHNILITVEIVIEERRAKEMKAKKKLSSLRNSNNELQQHIQAR